ncbi:unnamed protein product [Pylaiella littoralis]
MTLDEFKHIFFWEVNRFHCDTVIRRGKSTWRMRATTGSQYRSLPLRCWYRRRVDPRFKAHLYTSIHTPALLRKDQIHQSNEHVHGVHVSPPPPPTLNSW